MAGPQPTQHFEALYDAAKKAREPYDKDALLNLAFYLDNHYVEWVAEWASIRDIPRDEETKNTPRPVVNKISHFVLQEHSYALANRPTPDVLPATDDPLDVSTASVALAYLRWLAEPQVADYDAELSDAVLWALASGEGWLKWAFNSVEKRPDVFSCSPFDLYLDPYCKRAEHARYIIHSQFMDVEQVYDIYGVKVKPSEVAKTDQDKSALLRDMGQAPVLQGADVKELWLKPGVSRRHPDGLFVTWCGREFLRPPEDFPYKHGKLPFTQLGSIKRPNSPHYTCIVKYLRAPQMELNKYHSQRIQTRQNFANPKWWIPDELEMQVDPDDSHGQILRGNSGGGQLAPQLIEPSSLPDNGDGDWLRQEMMDVAGLHEVSQGSVPGRVEAAKAIELLKESDTSRLAELERTIKRATSNGFWQSLMLCKQFAPEEQIVQTYSREGLPEVQRFKAENITPGMRVQVTMGTGLARSRAARQDQALLMWNDRIIQDPEVMADLMEIPVGTIAPQRAFDVKLARNENLVMIGGESDDGPGTPVAPNSWDAHDIHLREHNNYRKTSEFLAQPEPVKTKFEAHCQMHEDLQLAELQKEAEKQALVQAALAGAPPVTEETPGEAPPIEPAPESAGGTLPA